MLKVAVIFLMSLLFLCTFANSPFPIPTPTSLSNGDESSNTIPVENLTPRIDVLHNDEYVIKAPKISETKGALAVTGSKKGKEAKAGAKTATKTASSRALQKTEEIPAISSKQSKPNKDRVSTTLQAKNKTPETITIKIKSKTTKLAKGGLRRAHDIHDE